MWVPLDYGQSRRGVDMGLSAMRYAGVMRRLEAIGHNLKDEGDVPVSAVEQKDGEISNLKNLREVVQATSELANRVSEVVEKGNFPLVLGGDHSIAIGTIAGLVPKYKNLGVIWYDAHVDMNTAETSPSGNIHGMPLAVLMGLGHERLVNIFREGPKIKPENIVVIGARSVDPGERQLIKEKGIKVFTMHEIDRDGIMMVKKGSNCLFESEECGWSPFCPLDLDGLDPLYTPGVGTPVPGGITYRESHLAMEMLEDSGMITSAEFVEVNPILDNEKNKTADVAVALMGSLFGEKLL